MRSKKKKIYFVVYQYFIYTDRREIKLCKKFIYSYSTRLVFHMPGFYLLTKLNYFIVVPESGELPCTYSGTLKLKHRSAFFLRVKLASNIWFPPRESNPGRLGKNQKSFFSKFIACCITCRRNGTGSFSLISPDVSFLNSKFSQYPAAPHGLVPSSLYEILLGI